MTVNDVNGRQQLLMSLVSSGISAVAIRTHIGSEVAHSQSIISHAFSIKEFIEGIMVGHSSTKQTTKKGRREVGF